MPAGTVLSGFLYPIDLLPPGLEAVARLMPTAWAMEAVVHSISGDAAVWRIVADWAICLFLVAAFFAVSAYLFRIAEQRVRLSGNLARG